MDFKTFLENFDAIAEAPGGIQKLRSLILDLAVRGKLVPQNPEDEPASVLLDKIKFEKEQLIKEKKIRKLDPLSPIELEEMSYELPSGWEWVRFGDATICRDGERIPLSREQRILRQGEYDYYGASGVIDKIDGYLFDKSLLLIGEDGANLVNRSTPIAFIASGKYWVNNHAHVLDSLSVDCLRYFEVFINAIDLKPFVTGTAQPKMNQAKMNSIPVPLPPLAEQKRIVEKVDELMALCDRLQQSQETRDNLRQKLRASAIDSLMNAETDEELKKSWAIVRGNWHTLSQKAEDVNDLRRSVLYLAVRGKLVSQDVNDEPAEQLLKVIADNHSVDERKFRKPKDLLPIDKIDKPFELPIGWCWCRFTDIGLLERGRSKYRPRNDPSLYENGSIPLIQTGDIARANGVVRTYTAMYNENGLAQSRLWSKGTLCITIAANIGDSAILGFDACFPDSVVGFLPTNPIEDARYFEFFLRTLKSTLENFAPSTAQKNINLAILDEVLIPLPPLAEQKRIVVKVDELMQMSDQLEESLCQSQQRAEALAASAISYLTF